MFETIRFKIKKDRLEDIYAMAIKNSIYDLNKLELNDSEELLFAYLNRAYYDGKLDMGKEVMIMLKGDN